MGQNDTSNSTPDGGRSPSHENEDSNQTVKLVKVVTGPGFGSFTYRLPEGYQYPQGFTTQTDSPSSQPAGNTQQSNPTSATAAQPPSQTFHPNSQASLWMPNLAGPKPPASFEGYQPSSHPWGYSAFPSVHVQQRYTPPQPAASRSTGTIPHWNHIPNLLPLRTEQVTSEKCDGCGYRESSVTILNA
ncbi:hypothetical protein I302_108619 [Kwoniella bestiolae CBS 10118]|uniref:Uncharacterized protein n=1 Tax=Kwoniella bestiolae CBS 10118 TaxID=1296100 RepID=A0A1B9FTK8_9TREE|nr:hypothetical protein I302_07756 [Kwoniella bestiolae CBS 10118]OCF22114.1 hypothetical protein I302_07756 [Kwoniella bestiolae CBS 10118]